LKILIISTQVPYPTRDGATIRVFNLLKELSRKHDIFLATIVRGPAEKRHLEAIRPFCKEIHAASVPRSRWKRWAQILTAPFVAEPHLVRINRSAELQEIVSRLASVVDAIQAEFPQGGQYFNGFAGIKVLDQHNVEADILRSSCRFDRSLVRRAFDYVQVRKMARFETRLCGQVDMVLATSSDDASVLRSFNPNVLVVPNGVGEAVSNENHVEPVITFTGLMSYRANVDAMLFFREMIWPTILKAETNAKLFIVGRDPSPAVVGLRSAQIEVTGEVEDVDLYLRQTSVFVAPLRVGSGTRIKILQAMSYGLPVVSTSLGCKGISLENGRHIIIEDDPTAFAHRVISLLRDPVERARIGRNGRDLVHRKYTWRSIGTGLSEKYGQWASV
jgi:glycosyltransferase involved in cell wall biosynthesis